MEFPDRFAGAEDSLHAAASARCGLHEFGDPSYLEGLAQLLDSLQHDLARGSAEREACFAVIVGLLVARLYTEEGRRCHPELFAAPLERPVFIVGAPRTGTTALHQLLATDPAWQGLDSWLSRTPMPRPPRAQWSQHAEFRSATAAHARRMADHPEFRAIHAVAPDEVDECIHATSQTMISNTFGSIMHVPGYDRWFRSQDFRPAFDRLRQVLQLIGGREPGRRWLLKNPSHVLDLELLLEVFPDASVVYLHRDPLAAQPSLWSLLSLHRRRHDGDRFDPRSVARREIELYAPALLANIPVVARHAGRILEVREDELIADPLSLAARIYAHAGQPLTPGVKAALARWIDEHQKGRHGRHRYAAEEFGVSRARLAEHFCAYRAHYGFTAAP